VKDGITIYKLSSLLHIICRKQKEAERYLKEYLAVTHKAVLHSWLEIQSEEETIIVDYHPYFRLRRGIELIDAEYEAMGMLIVRNKKQLEEKGIKYLPCGKEIDIFGMRLLMIPHRHGFYLTRLRL